MMAMVAGDENTIAMIEPWAKNCIGKEFIIIYLCLYMQCPDKMQQ